MKIKIVSIVLVCLAMVMLSGCATSQEKAVRDAELAKQVTAALAERNYKIGVRTMIPHRGSSQNVSFNYSLEDR